MCGEGVGDPLNPSYYCFMERELQRPCYELQSTGAPLVTHAVLLLSKSSLVPLRVDKKILRT